MPRHGGWGRTAFGDRLKALRDAARMTQAELAERAGCHPMSVSELERGIAEPAWPFVLVLAKVLGCEPNDFRASEDEAPPSARAGRGRPKKGK